MKNVFELFYGTLLIYMHTREARFFVFREYGEFEMVGSAADCAEYVLLVAVLPPPRLSCLTPVFHVSCFTPS